MKTCMRIQVLILALILALTSFTTVAFAAADTDEGYVVETYDFQITSEMVDENGQVAIPFGLAVDQTFNMSSYHRGADRTYSGTELGYAVTITDANGNAVSDRVIVELHDYNSATAIKASSVNADGSLNYFTVPIVTNRVYYFVYSKVSGTTSTLRVHMRIYTT